MQPETYVILCFAFLMFGIVIGYWICENFGEEQEPQEPTFPKPIPTEDRSFIIPAETIKPSTTYRIVAGWEVLASVTVPKGQPFKLTVPLKKEEPKPEYPNHCKSGPDGKLESISLLSKSCGCSMCSIGKQLGLDNQKPEDIGVNLGNGTLRVQDEKTGEWKPLGECYGMKIKFNPLLDATHPLFDDYAPDLRKQLTESLEKAWEHIGREAQQEKPKPKKRGKSRKSVRRSTSK